MRTFKKNILAIITISVTTFTACTEVIVEPCISEPKFYKMSMRESGSGTFFKLFTYDNCDRIVKTEMNNASVEYTYGVSLQPKQYKISYKNGSPSQIASIYYQPDSRNIDYILSEYSEKSSTLKDSSVFEYRNDSISKITHYTFTVAGASQGYMEAGYNEFIYDLQGNILKEIRTSGGNTEILEFTYDTKRSAWKPYISNRYHPLLGVICSNNVVSMTYTDTNGMTDQDKSYTISYTYDKNAYPLSAQYIFLNGKTESYTIEYK